MLFWITWIEILHSVQSFMLIKPQLRTESLQSSLPVSEGKITLNILFVPEVNFYMKSNQLYNSMSMLHVRSEIEYAVIILWIVTWAWVMIVDIIRMAWWHFLYPLLNTLSLLDYDDLLVTVNSIANPENSHPSNHKLWWTSLTQHIVRQVTRSCRRKILLKKFIFVIFQVFFHI